MAASGTANEIPNVEYENTNQPRRRPLCDMTDRMSSFGDDVKLRIPAPVKKGSPNPNDTGISQFVGAVPLWR